MARKIKPNIAFRRWISARSMCATCGRPGVLHEDGNYYLDPSHVKSKGSGGRDENNIIPQCRQCHTKYGVLGRKQYEKMLDIDLEELARSYWARYVKEKGMKENNE